MRIKRALHRRVDGARFAMKVNAGLSAPTLCGAWRFANRCFFAAFTYECDVLAHRVKNAGSYGGARLEIVCRQLV
jgi:hypothetical protein